MRRTWRNPAVVLSDDIIVYDRGRKYNDPATDDRSQRAQVDSFLRQLIRFERRRRMAIRSAEWNAYYPADTRGFDSRYTTGRWNVQRDDQYQQQCWNLVSPCNAHGDFSSTDVLSDSLIVVVFGDSRWQLTRGTES